ncbi:hypothetical protein LTR56_021213 [Elasticomyces elasticus]|nr:hypothetical protein LTR56_021213 [Elasticomyces elasticus]KAK3665253.1 hypothetical protein LTR22_003775 [Elasticomyces elasticus]KAK4933452.1 hypothetical protein LTR49_000446 [Elasticomyces elasticus]KAK5751203.1 hypothetical protein LTS12_018755 [Elasticomyces elasticus]
MAAAVSANIEFYLEGDRLLWSGPATLPSIAVRELPEMLKPFVISCIADNVDIDVPHTHRYEYAVGLRFRDCEQYVKVDGELNIDELTDLRTDQESIDLRVDIAVAALEEASESKDWTDAVQPGDSAASEETYYRIARAIPHDSAQAKLNGIEAYEVLLAQRKAGSPRSAGDLTLWSVPIFYFGDVCFGDAKVNGFDLMPSNGTVMTIYYEPLDRNLDVLAILNQIEKKMPPQVRPGLPLMPPYTWNDMHTNSSFPPPTRSFVGIIQVAVLFVDRTDCRMEFPQGFLFEMDTTDDAVKVCERKIMGALAHADRKTRKLLSSETYQDAWTFEIWVLPQTSGPRKMHLWLARDHGAPTLNRTANFSLVSCLDVSEEEGGAKAKLFMQVVIGPSNSREWMVTGSSYMVGKEVHGGADASVKTSEQAGDVEAEESSANGAAEARVGRPTTFAEREARRLGDGFGDGFHRGLKQTAGHARRSSKRQSAMQDGS